MADKTGQTQSYQYSFPERALVSLFKFINRFVSWDKLPSHIGILNLLAFRLELRAKNLYDGYAQRPETVSKTDEPMPADNRWLGARNSDGLWNSLEMPKMGCAGARFGRNVPRHIAKRPTDEDLMTPNPRLVSETFMKRTEDEFKPATTLNLLAAAWIQFQIHDWVFHEQQYEKNFEVPLAKGDSWPAAKEGKMVIPQSSQDKSLDPSDSVCPGYINTQTPWWDGSQIYGSTQAITNTMRTQDPDGKLLLSKDNTESFLPRDPKTGLPETGLNNNWWTGLELLTTLFALEHNSLCDMFRLKHPDWSGDQIFDKARLVNSALMAKIHTVEWTPGILAHPALQIAMNANWWGLAGETLTKLLGRFGGEVFSGIPGSGVDHDGVPYSLTEEFTSVYRLHTLIPDNVAFFDVTTGKHEKTIPIQDLCFNKSQEPLQGKKDEDKFADAFYSFGINYPGAIRNNNYPNFLRDVVDPTDKVERDMATIDVIRDRERGVPRYCEMRRQLHMSYPKTFIEMTGGDQALAKKLEEVYKDVEKVDMVVGCQAEPLPKGFGFSDTQFRVFILMASRRLKSDRFIATQYNEKTYTPEGFHWLNYTTMKDVLIRHFPALEETLKNQKNVFAPWPQKPASKEYKGRETNAPSTK